MFGAGIRLLALVALVLIVLLLVASVLGPAYRAISARATIREDAMSGKALPTIAYLLLAGLFVYVAVLGSV